MSLSEFLNAKQAKKFGTLWHEENEECANLTLMASHHSDDEENEVSDCEINDKPSYAWSPEASSSEASHQRQKITRSWSSSEVEKT